MIDISKIKYRLVIMTEDKKQYNITDFVENLGWEENERELATRISFSVSNQKTSAGRISSIAKLGCLVGVFATDENGKNIEVARGYIVDWKATVSGSGNQFDVTCYDELYNLQQSQDNIFYASGISTKSAIMQIFEAWGVSVDTYNGPDATHGKLVYKSESLSNVILDILDDAKKKGGVKAIIRASKGKVSVLEQGNNKPVYHFESDNTKVATHKKSTSGMVTRVKVIGQADDDGKSNVEATLNGLTQYGIRQKIYSRGKDDNLDDAQKAAQDILNEQGKIQEEITVQSPDIPLIRKGDLVHLKVGTLKGYYFVQGIRHDADSMSMTMELKQAELKTVGDGEVISAPNNYNVGDVVQYKGGTHYFSSYSGARGYDAGAGPAKITEKNGSGKTHPWHLIHTDRTSNVYGWVDDGTFE